MRLFDIYRVTTDLRHEANPVFTLTATDTRAAREKANKLLLREGRNRGYDLAWTDARKVTA